LGSWPNDSGGDGSQITAGTPPGKTTLACWMSRDARFKPTSENASATPASAYTIFAITAGMLAFKNARGRDRHACARRGPRAHGAQHRDHGALLRGQAREAAPALEDAEVRRGREAPARRGRARDDLRE